MHVFQVKGFSGFLMLLLAIISTVLLLMLLPASFMMVLWNALVFESLHGPEISLYQGFLLWGVIMVLLKVIFKPEIRLQFQSIPGAKTKKGKPVAKIDASSDEATKTPSVTVDDHSAEQK